ncbi:U6 small nuclear RNA (adenine-(43)-N(6))-methyltransferase isoform X2 [Eucalyptus grandis]|uniref:U6 small nuclear RNA (adenine-(43)-N(6))-methyltransferase isoform X2 n=1 Tax=Eucalyptus grandis TaxID=71139 RepID=UPI00192EE139|nr:U6 small nuclear RNA (adenine-(43)-N(6))-methyltransferase isoform X2 [Eucalyptus grandis]
MKNKKRRREQQPRPAIHPRNKYSENPPDFALLASLYPSFNPFVSYGRDARPRIDWTDFNATRELTRVLLLHDHGLHWWIPDGQLCPTVPNRSNYIHWIEDLLSSEIIPKINNNADNIRGFDIGTGANCIYPLLGASLLGWSFVGTDMMDVALEWAERNVKTNPQISDLIEIRKVNTCMDAVLGEDSSKEDLQCYGSKTNPSNSIGSESAPVPSSRRDDAVEENSYSGPPILFGVVRDGETFDFCMCNPPFFESMEEAGLNPKTSCGGTPQEMVCPGGEKAFITRIIEDSVRLKQSFRWYTSMVGRKSNLKSLIAKLREVGVTIVKTTEFVQGQTCRWGIAWSFVPPARQMISPYVAEKSNLSFMLEITASNDHLKGILRNKVGPLEESLGGDCEEEPPSGSDSMPCPSNDLSFRITVFQQIPGTLLVKGSLQRKDGSSSGAFSSIFQRLEGVLKQKFCREKASVAIS